MPLFDDENEAVQRHVVETIARLATADAAEVLAQRLTETQSFSISSALGGMGPIAEGPVLAQLQDGNPDVDAGRYLLNVLGKVGGQESLPLLERIAADVDHPNRSSARTAMPRIQRRLADASPEDE